MKNLISNGISLRALGVSVLVAGLVACGGGGGGGAAAPAPTAPVTISQANAQSVTGVALQGALGVTSTGSLAAGVQTSNATPNNRVLSRLTASVAQKIAAQSNAPASVTGVAPATACEVSGTFHVDLPTPTSATITFTNCLDFLGETINGVMAVTNIVSSSTATAINDSGTVSFNLTVASTGSPTVTLTGGYSYTYTGTAVNYVPTNTTVTLTGSSITMTEGTRIDVFSNFRFSDSFSSTTNIYTGSANFTISSTVIGGSVTFATITPFQTNAANFYPHVGVAHISSSAGPASLHVTVLGNELAAPPQVRIDVDLDGALPIVYEVTVDTTWALLDS